MSPAKISFSIGSGVGGGLSLANRAGGSPSLDSDRHPVTRQPIDSGVEMVSFQVEEPFKSRTIDRGRREGEGGGSQGGGSSTPVTATATDPRPISDQYTTNPRPLRDQYATNQRQRQQRIAAASGDSPPSESWLSSAGTGIDVGDVGGSRADDGGSGGDGGGSRPSKQEERNRRKERRFSLVHTPY